MRCLVFEAFDTAYRVLITIYNQQRENMRVQKIMSHEVMMRGHRRVDLTSLASLTFTNHYGQGGGGLMAFF